MRKNLLLLGTSSSKASFASVRPFCNVQIELFAVWPSPLQEGGIVFLFGPVSPNVTKQPEVLAVMSSLNNGEWRCKSPKINTPRVL